MRNALVLAIASLVATSLACGSSPAPSASTETAPTVPPETAPVTLDGRIVVDQVAVFQGVKVTLVSEEAFVQPNAPIIAGRPALVRVHANAVDRTQRGKQLEAELTVRTDGRDDVIIRDAAKRLVELDDADLTTTFNFELAEGVITPTSTLAVTLRDREQNASLVFPADGPLDLGARDDSPVLRVKFVPVRYDSDGSGRLPDLDSDVLESYRSSLFKMYPASKVELDVRAPMPWTNAVAGNGEGWDELLYAIMDQRYADEAPDDVYYVGIFAPARSASDYCRQGCVMGVAPAAGLREVGLRVAMIVGYPGSYAETTLAQELAHAMGREHAPCGGAGGPDRKYPYARGGIGVWGYDLVTKDLVDPSGRARDFMGYCSPAWVSDYTYAGIYERMAAVAKTKRPEQQQSQAGKSRGTRVPSVRVTRDGRRRPGPLVEVSPGVRDGGGVAREIDGIGGSIVLDH